MNKGIGKENVTGLKENKEVYENLNEIFEILLNKNFQKVFTTERFKEMHLTTLKEGRERGDLITIYKLINNLEETDRKDLIMTWKGKAKYLKGHKKKLQKGIFLNDTKRYSFPQRSIDTWNGLKER